MSIELTCPHCKQLLEAEDSMEGESLKCPNCNNNILVTSKTIKKSPPKKKIIIFAILLFFVIAGVISIKSCRTNILAKRQAEVQRLSNEQKRKRKAEAKRLSDEQKRKAKDERWLNTISGKSYTIPGLGMKLIYVAPGKFKMGSNNGYPFEKPVHRVTISKGYLIGKYEVTQSEYQSIMGTNPSTFKDSNKPVEQVSWNDAVKFCEKLTSRERAADHLPSSREYRLPTEAEWEFAARGGNKSRDYQYSGSDNVDSVAWYGDNSGKQTHKVGTKSSNELGIYDMSGNVSEWCNDLYGLYFRISETDPKGTSSGPSRSGMSSGSDRVIRGGGWNARLCRVAGRSYRSPSRTISILGFRVVLAFIK